MHFSYKSTVTRGHYSRSGKASMVTLNKAKYSHIGHSQLM